MNYATAKNRAPYTVLILLYGKYFASGRATTRVRPYKFARVKHPSVRVGTLESLFAPGSPNRILTRPNTAHDRFGFGTQIPATQFVADFTEKT